MSRNANRLVKRLWAAQGACSDRSNIDVGRVSFGSLRAHSASALRAGVAKDVDALYLLGPLEERYGSVFFDPDLIAPSALRYSFE